LVQQNKLIFPNILKNGEVQKIIGAEYGRAALPNHFLIDQFFVNKY